MKRVGGSFTLCIMKSAFLGNCPIFYGGADDNDLPTCFTANAPLCAVCRISDAICQESSDIQDYLLLLFQTIKTTM